MLKITHVFIKTERFDTILGLHNHIIYKWISISFVFSNNKCANLVLFEWKNNAMQAQQKLGEVNNYNSLTD